MTASRFLAGLLQPLLALLLLAGSPADRLRAEDRPLVRGIDSAAKPSGGQREWAGIPAEAPLEPGPSGGDDGPDAEAVGAERGLTVLDAGRFVRISRGAYATAPPTHRACAAPPTGPPLA